MTSKEIEQRVISAKDNIIREVTDRLPRRVAVTATQHFRQNFRDQGFLDGGLHAWKRTQRQMGDGPDARYGALLSRREHLSRSIQSQTAPGQVTILNPVPYAAIHNQGGTVNSHPRVTSRLRKFAWAMVYKAEGVKKGGKLPKNLSLQAQKWRAMALTKKSTLSVTAHIPQRQFMGPSAELSQKIDRLIRESIQRIKQQLI